LADRARPTACSWLSGRKPVRRKAAGPPRASASGAAEPEPSGVLWHGQRAPAWLAGRRVWPTDPASGRVGRIQPAGGGPNGDLRQRRLRPDRNGTAPAQRGLWAVRARTRAGDQFCGRSLSPAGTPLRQRASPAAGLGGCSAPALGITAGHRRSTRAVAFLGGPWPWARAVAVGAGKTPRSALHGRLSKTGRQWARRPVGFAMPCRGCASQLPAAPLACPGAAGGLAGGQSGGTATAQTAKTR